MSAIVENKKISSNEDADSDEEIEQPVEATKADEPVEDTTLANSDVVTKYQEAAKIAQQVMAEVILMCVPGARIVDICRFGDNLIEQKTSAIFKGKSKSGKIILKGVAFPVCISVNECVCHCSPLESDDSYPLLALEDMVKIDLGVHIDGFIAVTAHTALVGYPNIVPPEALATGPRSNVVNAAYMAAEVAVKLLKPGNTNNMITSAIKSVAELYGVNPISGTLSHQMKQFVVDGNKMILLREMEGDREKVEACKFETYEVYALDIAMSTGEGKPRETGNRTTVFKRAVDRKYSLKVKSSRQFFNEINKRFPTLPFSLRSLPDEKSAKLGIRECVTHELLTPFPVLNERKGDFVAHVKVTVLIMPSGPVAITGLAPITLGALGGDLEAAQSNPFSGIFLYEKLLEQRGLALPVKLGDEASAVPADTQPGFLPESILEILRYSKPENKKKSKKAAAKKKAAADVATETKA
eukprot:gene7036-9608_t